MLVVYQISQILFILTGQQEPDQMEVPNILMCLNQAE
jgi:hypothetical protein